MSLLTVARYSALSSLDRHGRSEPTASEEILGQYHASKRSDDSLQNAAAIRPETAPGISCSAACRHEAGRGAGFAASRPGTPRSSRRGRCKRSRTLVSLVEIVGAE